jgi:hypothetical protein
MTFASRALAAIGVMMGAGLLLQAAPAQASLGRAYASIDTDRLMLHATVNSASVGTYTVHTLTLANAGVVKEYTRPDGAVFAVVWRAPGRPDLRQLLGGNFDAVQADNAPRGGRRRLRLPIAVNRSDLVVQSGGHPGAFWGAAVMPGLQPAGFSASDLK